MSRVLPDDGADSDGIDADDLPATHLDDDEYDEFLAREFDDEGGLRGDPPVARIIVGIVIAVVVLALLLLR